MTTLDQTLPAAVGTEPAKHTLAHATDTLLRDPHQALARIRDGHDLSTVARATILTIALGAGILGVAMGLYRGGTQALYSGIKLPLVLLLTTAVCAPALTAINAALGRPSCLRRDLALVLSSLARMSLVLAALAPVVLLTIRWNASYHALALLVVICCVIGAGVGLSFFARGLYFASPKPFASAALAFLAVFSVVGTQMSWTFRPFLLRPRAPNAVFLRPVEGSLLESVLTSFDSARGVYNGGTARNPDAPWAVDPSGAAPNEER